MSTRRRLKPLLTRPQSLLELWRLNPYRGRRYELLFWEKNVVYPFPRVMVNPFVTLFPYSCLTACAIAGRLPKYCAFFSTNCWNKPQALCARATIRVLSVSFYTLQRAHCTFFHSVRPKNHLLAAFHFRSTCLAEKPDPSPSPSTTTSYKVCVTFQTWEYHVYILLLGLTGVV